MWHKLWSLLEPPTYINTHTINSHRDASTPTYQHYGLLLELHTLTLVARSYVNTHTQSTLTEMHQHINKKVTHSLWHRAGHDREEEAGIQDGGTPSKTPWRRTRCVEKERRTGWTGTWCLQNGVLTNCLELTRRWGWSLSAEWVDGRENTGKDRWMV